MPGGAVGPAHDMGAKGPGVARTESATPFTRSEHGIQWSKRSQLSFDEEWQCSGLCGNAFSASASAGLGLKCVDRLILTRSVCLSLSLSLSLCAPLWR